MEFLIKRIQRLGKYQDKIRFHEYGSGKELLSAMNEVRFSLIFMDVCMEDISVCLNYSCPYHNLSERKGRNVQTDQMFYYYTIHMCFCSRIHIKIF